MSSLDVLALETLDATASGVVYRSLGGEPAFLAFDGHQTSGAGNGRYELILDLPTDRPALTPESRWLFVVGVDLDAGHEADFEDWYNVEHLPALATVPGVIRATRFRRAATDETPGFPAYLALYEIESPDIAGNPDWKDAVETPWTQRVRQHFQARWRGGYEREESADE